MRNSVRNEREPEEASSATKRRQVDNDRFCSTLTTLLRVGEQPIIWISLHIKSQEETRKGRKNAAAELQPAARFLKHPPTWSMYVELHPSPDSSAKEKDGHAQWEIKVVGSSARPQTRGTSTIHMYGLPSQITR